ncbi:MAG: glycosyltransferase family 39 protein [Syntrophorhabdales bacterium]|jgi:hypothetical protein
MIARLFFALAAPLTLGLVLTRLAWRPRPVGARACVLQLALASGIGASISSCTFFLWLASPFSSSESGFCLVEPVLLLAAAAACLAPGLLRDRGQRGIDSAGPACDAYKAHSSGDSADSAETENPGHIPKGLVIAFCVACACALVALIMVSMNKPHGGGDSYAIWNLRARFLFRGHDGRWGRGFSSLIAWSHPDYPLLVPSTIARLWTYLGTDTPRAAQLVSAFFTVETFVLVLFSLAFLRGVTQGLPAALFLLGCAPFIRLGGSQYADIPMGFFMLSSLVLLAVGEEAEGEGHGGLVTLAGTAAGFAAWTKNEGMLFVCAILAARAVVLLVRRGPRVSFRESARFLSGLLPVLLVVFYFKGHYAPPNDLFGSQGLQPFVQRLTDLHRYGMIAKTFAHKMLSWGNGLTPVFAAYLVAVGVGAGAEAGRRYGTTAATGFVMLALMVVGYFFTYVLTPHDLRWHLDSSLERLLLQLWPSFLFVVFLTTRPWGGAGQGG